MDTGDAEVISKTIDEVVEPEVLFHAPVPTGATGAQALKQVWAVLLRAFPDIHVAVQDVIAEGDKVVARNTVTGTHQGEYGGLPPTGNSVTYNEIFAVRFAGHLDEIGALFLARSSLNTDGADSAVQSLASRAQQRRRSPHVPSRCHDTEVRGYVRCRPATRNRISTRKGGGAMKAIRIHEPTGISGLVYEEVPDATPGLCDVLVKVAACGITHNELDWPVWTCRAGHQRTSIIPGHEVSGVVAALGYGTAGIAVGDEVFGLADQLRDGAAAEYVAVEARNVAPKPQTADHIHAAAVPRAGLTAWQALFDHGKLAKGQTVVIHGAGGAVGSTAVQLARWAGARVIGTGRSRARPLVTELGADRFLALDADRLEDASGQADLVLDTIGGEVLARSPALLRPGGTLVTIKAAARPSASRDDIRQVVFVQESSRAQLAELARLVDEGHLRPEVGAVYPLARAAEAYSAKAGGGVPGRIVLQP